MREEIVAFVTQLIVAPRGAGPPPRRRGTTVTPTCPSARSPALAEALVGAAESLAAWANATPGVTARQAAATLMNFAWAGLGDLMDGRPWSPPPTDT